MKQRNHLLALALLALFAATGFIYFHHYTERKPFGIVLFVGEGLIPSKLAAARLYDGGADRRLTIDSLPNLALISTHAADFAVPDAAAASSALACGVKVNNRALSVDPTGQARATLFELARLRGRATGLVTNGRLTDPTLSEMTRSAIENLQRRRGGYLLVVDAGLISRASQRNDGERTLRELLELDRAVAVALEYAGAQTLVVVAGGESTGGMVLNGYPLRQDHGVSLLGLNAEGLPSITWATGPNGPSSNPVTPAPMAPAAFYAPAGVNVVDSAVAAGFGPGSERLRGLLDNTFVFNLVNAQL